MGYCYDGVLSMHYHEVGVIRHARLSASHNWVANRLKVGKALHNMLHGLTAPAAQVVGLISTWWKWQLLRMACARGYMCILCPDAVRTMPLSVSPDSNNEFACLLAMIWKMRMRPPLSLLPVLPKCASNTRQFLNLSVDSASWLFPDGAESFVPVF